MTFLQRALQSLPAAATSPLAFLAFALTIGAWAWCSYQIQLLKTAREGMKDVPDSQRPGFLRTFLNRVVPNSIDASEWIKSERQRYVFYFFLACLLLVLCLASLAAWTAQNVVSPQNTNNSGTIVSVQSSPGAIVEVSPKLPKITTLVLTESKKGWQTFDGSIHEFTLSNPLSGLAIVESIELEVLEVMEDKWSTTQALIDTYKYEVNLDPTFLGAKKITGDFKYSPGDVDKISVLLRSRGGFDYFVRFVVTWEDALKNARLKTYTSIQIARFPSTENQKKLDINEMGKGDEQHSKDLETRLHALRNTLTTK